MSAHRTHHTAADAHRRSRTVSERVRDGLAAILVALTLLVLSLAYFDVLFI